jgi:hypothetical protein
MKLSRLAAGYPLHEENIYKVSEVFAPHRQFREG